MKVLLVSTNKYKNPYPVYPIGLDYVAGAIADSHEVRILDLCPSGNNREVTNAIREFRPDLVGMSLRNIDNVDGTYPLEFTTDFQGVARQIREATPAPIVLGGSAFNIFPEELMRITGADYGIIGEGEKLKLLLEALGRGGDPALVPGVIRPGGKPGRNEPWTGEIRRRSNRNDPHLGFYLQNGGMMNIQTKRGCPFNCSYCTYPLLEGNKTRCFDPGEVAAQALELQEAGAKFIFFTDSSFNADVKYSLEVGGALARKGVRIPWGAFFSPIPMPDDYYRKLAEGGLSHVEFGTDSLCDEMLVSLNKPFDVRAVISGHNAACAAGLKVAHYLLCGAPGENRETLETTFSRAEKLEKCVIFIFCGIRVYPRTSLWDLAVAQNRIGKDAVGLDPIFYSGEFSGCGEINKVVKEKINGKTSWIIGDGGEKIYQTIARFHRRGYPGPLWEKLIQ
ncbi:MAG: cobalamin-dependent protein [bacterium]|nr:cobalamin-dependent protein [bacterium]